MQKLESVPLSLQPVWQLCHHRLLYRRSLCVHRLFSFLVYLFHDGSLSLKLNFVWQFLSIRFFTRDPNP
jgi:hypothetical protein